MVCEGKQLIFIKEPEASGLLTTLLRIKSSFEGVLVLGSPV